MKDRGSHPLLDLANVTTDDVEGFLGVVGAVFAVYRGHDSGNTSAGVIVNGRRWFVKWAADPEAICHLESAVRFDTAVRHPAIAALRAWFTFRRGWPWCMTGSPARRSTTRWHQADSPGRTRDQRSRGSAGLPVHDVLAAYGTILDAHRAVAERGFVAVDFYDGCLIYDFARRMIWLCDLDCYRPGPLRLGPGPPVRLGPASWHRRSPPRARRSMSVPPSSPSAAPPSSC